ncbi:hypothetical protein CIRG_09900 [Coccidioides immitis RMSCC 2394]|uniref:Uncharacterized protein n=1 Tax=Coccidioides immitis RMSCC 2394 TaxID=404692 RepID=A0A0J6YSE7_COCIT|nr:hypothetical protein CIRG_09900 [Coccidioides immitis RMSCC 2394]
MDFVDQPSVMRLPRGQFTKRIRISSPEQGAYEGETAERKGKGRTMPPDEKREMKYMFTDAPASNVSTLPEPFRKAIENSRLWQWERQQGMENTGCLASLFPKDVAQDVSFTIWCGHDDGYHLNSVFGMRRAIAN